MTGAEKQKAYEAKRRAYTTAYYALADALGSENGETFCPDPRQIALDLTAPAESEPSRQQAQRRKAAPRPRGP